MPKMAARAGTDHTGRPGRPGRRHHAWLSDSPPAPAPLSVAKSGVAVAGRSETAGTGSMTVVMAVMVTAPPACPVHVGCGRRRSVPRARRPFRLVGQSHLALSVFASAWGTV